MCTVYMYEWAVCLIQNSQQTGHGEEFSDTAASVSKSAQVIAVGLNCLAPQDVEVCALTLDMFYM